MSRNARIYPDDPDLTRWIQVEMIHHKARGGPGLTWSAYLPCMDEPISPQFVSKGELLDWIHSPAAAKAAQDQEV